MIDKTDPTNRDTVPAMLTPGEFVLNKEASTMFAPVIEQMNSAGLQHRAMKNMGGSIQHYNDGGTAKSKEDLISSVFKAEAGYSKDVNDNGNYTNGKAGKLGNEPFVGTNFGIAAPELKIYLGRTPTAADMKALTKEQAKGILVKNYYDKYQVAKVPPELQEIYFHSIFNSGGHGLKIMQEMLGMPSDQVDGIMGPTTMGYINKYSDDLPLNHSFSPIDFKNKLLDKFETFDTWDKHGAGWINRYHELSGDPNPKRELLNQATVNTSPRPQSRPETQQPEAPVTPPLAAPDTSLRPQSRPMAPDTSLRPQSRPTSPEPQQNYDQRELGGSSGYGQTGMAPNLIPQMQAAPPQPQNSDVIRIEQELANAARDNQMMPSQDMYAGLDPNVMIANQVSVPDPRFIGVPTPRGVQDSPRLSDMGAGGISNFPSSGYTAGYTDEKNMGGPIHLNTGGLSIDQMARRNLQEDVDNAWFKRNERDALTKFDQSQLLIDKMPQRQAPPEPVVAPPLDLSYLPIPNSPPVAGPEWMNTPPPDLSYLPIPNSDQSLLEGSSDSVEEARKEFPFKQLNYSVPRPGSGLGNETFGQGNIFTNGQDRQVISDPRETGFGTLGASGYGQTGDAISRRTVEQQRLMDLRESLPVGSPEHIKISDIITKALSPSMISLDELMSYNLPASIQDVPRMMGNNIPMGGNVIGNDFIGNDPDKYRRSEAQKRLMDLRERLEVGSPEHSKVSNLISGAFTPSMTSLEELTGYNIPPNYGTLYQETRENIPSLDNDIPPVVNKNYKSMTRTELERLATDGDDQAINQIRLNEIEAATDQSDMSTGGDNLYMDRIMRETLERGPLDIVEKQVYSARDTLETTLNVITNLEEYIRLNPGSQQAIQQLADAKAQAEANKLELAKAQEAEKRAEMQLTRKNSDVIRIEQERDNIVPYVNPADNTTVETTVKNPIADVENIVTNLEKENPVLTPAEKAAAEAAAAKLLADKVKNPEVTGAMAMLKGVFGNLFDSKELARAAVMYLGGRATGLSGNQALAFAGKNYIARVDAKESTYNKVAIADTHTKESLAIFKKSMDFGDLVTKGLPAVPTSAQPMTMYDRRTGREITLIQKKVGDGNYWFDGNKQVNLSTLTNDGRFAPNTQANQTYKKSIRDKISTFVGQLDTNNPKRDSAGAIVTGQSYLGIPKAKIGREAVVFAIENGMELEQMEELVEKAYNEALIDTKSGKKISGLSNYFSRAWVESNTTDAQNFFLPSKNSEGKVTFDKPVPIANITTFIKTLKDAAAREGQEELAGMNDTQVSSWLMTTDTYNDWRDLDPELRQGHIDTGAAIGVSGLMQYVMKSMVNGLIA